MTDRLHGKVAIVTGGGNGIGRACALAFADEGAVVVVADFRAEAAELVVDQIRSGGGTALVAQVDVADEASVQTMVESVVSAYSGIDVLMNCAGGGSTGPGADGSVVDLSLDEFWRTIRVDLFGTLLTCRGVLPVMAEAGQGSIINMSSLRAVIGTEGADAYTAAKGGVLSMSRAMAMQWAPKGVRVNVLAPGVVLSERVAAMISPDAPIYRKSLLGPSEPEDVASLAVYLAGDESRRMTGGLFTLDGGASIY